jgi:hypothetical protein
MRWKKREWSEGYEGKKKRGTITQLQQRNSAAEEDGWERKNERQRRERKKEREMWSESPKLRYRQWVWSARRLFFCCC